MMDSIQSPYLSLVVTSRNDSNEVLYRLQLFVNQLMAQSERYKLSCELIVVEWNYPSNRPRLTQALRWPEKSDRLQIRIIPVPAEIHNSFENSGIIPLFQMIAKNVGIRRARGRFVLATNIDILFSNELINFLASRKLQKHRMYRIDRFDVPSNIPSDLPINEQLDWCQRNVIQVYRYLETVNVTDGVIPPQKERTKSLIKTVRERFSHDEPLLHTNACGDFTLLATPYWSKVAGYPELPVRAMKLDGLLCYAAYYAGAQEYVLRDPMRIYHLDHPARSDGADVALSERKCGQPSDIQLTLSHYKALVEQMRQTRRPIIFNEDNWGLANICLPEIVVI